MPTTEKLQIKNFYENALIGGAYLVKNKSIAMAKNGKPYLNVGLMDESGEIAGRVWERAEELSEKFSQGDVVTIEGRVQSWNSKLQLNIYFLEALPKDAVDPSLFLPSSEKDPRDLMKQLRSLIQNEVRNSFMQELLLAYLDDEQIAQGMLRAPAAKGMHHVFIGGLLEHIVSLVKLSRAVIAHYHSEGYERINGDLIFAGLMLHDIGKIDELTYDTSFDYSSEGRLVGHLVMGIEMLDRKIAAIPDFPLELQLNLRHIIVSHHGQYEFGSPQLPMTLEALIVHYLDDLDSKVNSISSHIRKDASMEGEWTSFHRLYGRAFYKKNYDENFRGFPGDPLEEQPAEQPAEVEAPQAPAAPAEAEPTTAETKPASEPAKAQPGLFD